MTEPNEDQEYSIVSTAPQSPTDEYSDESLYSTPKRMSEIFDIKDGSSKRYTTTYDLRWIDYSKFSGVQEKIRKIRDKTMSDDTQSTLRSSSLILDNVKNSADKGGSTTKNENTSNSDEIVVDTVKTSPAQNSTEFIPPKTHGGVKNISIGISQGSLGIDSRTQIPSNEKSNNDNSEELDNARTRTPPMTPPVTPPVTSPPGLKKQFDAPTIERKPSKTGVGRTLLKRTVVVKRNVATTRKFSRRRRIMEASTTSNPASSNDPTDMEADFLPLKVKGLPWLPEPSHPPKLLHASLVPLPQHARRSTLLQSLDSRKPDSIVLSQQNKKQPNDKTVPKVGNRASQIFRRQLLEQSISMSFGGHHQSPPRRPRRRRTRKGSNAKLEDRKLRQERRKRESIAMNGGGSSNSEGTARKVDKEPTGKDRMILQQPITRNTNQQFLRSPRTNSIRRTRSISSHRAEKKHASISSSISESPFPRHLSSLRNRSSRTSKKFAVVGPPPVFSMNPGILSPTDDYNFNGRTEEERFTANNVPLSSATDVTSPAISPRKLGSGFFSLFSKRDHSKPSISVVPSPTTPKSAHLGFSPLSPRSPSATPSRSPSATPSRSPDVTPSRSPNATPSRSLSPVSRPTSPLRNSGALTSSADQLLRSGFARNNSESLSAHNKALTESEKVERLRKRQDLENIIAQTESESKKNGGSKMKALRTAIIATTTSCTSPALPASCATTRSSTEDRFVSRNSNSPSGNPMARTDDHLSDGGDVDASSSYYEESSRGRRRVTEEMRSDKFGSNVCKDGVVIKMTLTPPLFQ
ncbi:14970_t:CDS:1 [Acaulospora colombiana]|uniref:14970_t:CDS:1 n=1 Tax=Acaulospora colombiana TaxID=27376 RepID=A0ACA9M5F2_9GLOM|nr:14970_t:CDS:1 [Acaulospora colombiana]